MDRRGQKLSKRQHDTGIESFRANGIFPEVLVNFVALLGWSHNVGSDKMDLSRLIKNVIFVPSQDSYEDD